MKPADGRKKGEAELIKLLRELQEELRAFRFEMAGAQKRNIRRARSVRHDIALVKTLIREKARA